MDKKPKAFTIKSYKNDRPFLVIAESIKSAVELMHQKGYDTDIASVQSLDLHNVFIEEHLAWPEPQHIEWEHRNGQELSDFENAMMHIGESFFSKGPGLNPNDTAAIKEQAKLLMELAHKSESVGWTVKDEANSVIINSIIECEIAEYNDEETSPIRDGIQEAEEWFKTLRNRVQPQPRQKWSKEDEYYRNIILYILNNECVGNADKENAINWLKSIKDKVQPQPKQEWSEEDERIKDNCISFLGFNKKDSPQAKCIDECINWLKSRRWKPCDLPHWQKSNLPNHTNTGFNSDYFCHKGYCINYKELFEKLPKDD